MNNAVRQRLSGSSPSAAASSSATDISTLEISGHLLAEETHVVGRLLGLTLMTDQERRRIDVLARQLVQSARAGRQRFGGIDAFLHEYGLTSEEGIVLMCLAEALLRIPDADTADALIGDKMAQGDWASHLGRSASTFVNASTWGLLLTGRVTGLKRAAGFDPVSILKRLTHKSGEPVIRRALRQAMRLMGEQFVLGSDISAALKRAAGSEGKGYRFSYDMLGEAARTGADAEGYFARYADAIAAIGKAAGPMEGRSFPALMARPGISIKLSALHPRFEPSQEARVLSELVPVVVQLASMARQHDLGLCVDAEEADKLDLTLRVFARAMVAPELRDWHGLGLAVQAYGKRALPVLRWLRALSVRSGRRIPVRLVKGAYWDSEIKTAQERGWPDYPVFTRKAHTDVSYLACARFLLAEPDRFYGQFGTHNAHTIAAIHSLASDTPYEFQRLHGMGEALYGEVVSGEKLRKPCRVYAPVGGHGDLLSYLVRRLLENGANAAFVNRLADDDYPLEKLVRDPVQVVEASTGQVAKPLARPTEIFAPQRRNSLGLPVFERAIREPLLAEIDAALDRPHKVQPLVGGKSATAAQTLPVLSPHDRHQVVGEVGEASPEAIEKALALTNSVQADWDRLGGEARAVLLERAADLYERERALLVALLVGEAGKTVPHALDELREAVDLLRYYASEARRLFNGGCELAGPIGQRHQLSLHGRGVYACLSPWSSPLAVFTGQIAAALAAGNAVIAKPAEQTPLVAHRAVRLLLEAGIPADVLALLPGSGTTVGRALISDSRIAGVAFSGSSLTARQIQRTLADRAGPIANLIAACGGINAMVADSSALPEQVVRDAICAAFGSAGQHCQALGVLFVQAEAFEPIKEMLVGAIEQLSVGDPLSYSSDLGPVIDEAAEERLFAWKQHMRHEGQELVDLPLPDNCRKGTYVTPAAYQIERIGKVEDEIFGPILHLVSYQRAHLDKVCTAINETGYGMTLGVHSRIAATADFIAERVRVGNIYVNRNQTGAIAGALPVGGEGRSGTGEKAGGPNYLARFAVERVRSSDLMALGARAAGVLGSVGDD